MDIFQAVVLALLQGITEFLPISSSAHLILPSKLLGWTDQGLPFDVAVHVGTLLAVLIYYRKTISEMALGTLQSAQTKSWNPDARLAFAVVIGVIPAGLAGFLLDDIVEQHFRSTLVIAVATIGFGLLLGLADRRSEKRVDDDHTVLSVSIMAALIIGCAQALALIPGTSRSGITITAALLLGFSRTHAAHYSFLLSIPIILAAGLLKTLQLVGEAETVYWQFLLVGSIVSGLSAYFCIHWFLKLLDQIGMMPFVLYRVVLGIGLLFML